MSHYAPPVKTLLRALVAISLTALVMAGPAPASQAKGYSRTAKTDRANQVLALSLAKFTRLRKSSHTGIDGTLEWSADGCSAPKAFAGYSMLFEKSCNRHDFGYRNFGNGWAKGLALTSTPAKKDAIDKRFLGDMRRQCNANSNCLTAAQAYYGAVRKAGQAQTAFYKGECHPGKFCLFDDNGYRDRRIALTASENNMKDVSFGDKTSAVKNRSKVAWLLYDDHDYSDRHLCVRPGASLTNLDDYNFGDKTSSAKRLTGTTCP